MKQAVKVRQYWENLQNLSMPDKNILGWKFRQLKIAGTRTVAGCWLRHGEATKAYSQVKNLKTTGIDYSAERLKLARKITRE